MNYLRSFSTSLLRLPIIPTIPLLPPEIVFHILKLSHEEPHSTPNCTYCSTSRLATLCQHSLVCRRWREWTLPDLFEVVVITSIRQWEAFRLATRKHGKHVKVLRINLPSPWSGEWATFRWKWVMGRLPNLEVLSIYAPGRTVYWEDLAPAPKLQHLTLSKLRLYPRSKRGHLLWRWSPIFPSLRHLSLDQPMLPITPSRLDLLSITFSTDFTPHSFPSLLSLSYIDPFRVVPLSDPLLSHLVWALLPNLSMLYIPTYHFRVTEQIGFVRFLDLPAGWLVRTKGGVGQQLGKLKKLRRLRVRSGFEELGDGVGIELARFVDRVEKEVEKEGSSGGMKRARLESLHVPEAWAKRGNRSSEWKIVRQTCQKVGVRIVLEREEPGEDGRERFQEICEEMEREEQGGR